MERGTFTLLLGCGDMRSTLTLKNSGGVDLWYENKIKQLTVNPVDITGIIVGPGLVIEIFSDAHFSHLENTLENITNPKGHKYEVGCHDDHPIFKGIIRSFKVWDYDKYHTNARLVKYCDRDDECDDNEMCLCPGGEKLKEWCPVKRKRCLNKGLYFHSARRTTWDPDLINSDCMMRLIDEYNLSWPQYGQMKNLMKICQNKPARCGPRKDIREFNIRSNGRYYERGTGNRDRFDMPKKYKNDYVDTRIGPSSTDNLEGFGFQQRDPVFTILLVAFVILCFYFLNQR
jgi:hypothetical protein